MRGLCGSLSVTQPWQRQRKLARSAASLAIYLPICRGRFEPQIVRKRQRPVVRCGLLVLSLYAKGVLTWEISAHISEIYRFRCLRRPISRITDKGVEDMSEWSVRPLDEIYEH